MSAIDVEGLMDQAVAGSIDVLGSGWQEVLGDPFGAPDPARSGPASRAIVRQAQVERAPVAPVKVLALDEEDETFVGIDVLGAKPVPKAPVVSKYGGVP